MIIGIIYAYHLKILNIQKNTKSESHISFISNVNTCLVFLLLHV